MKRYVFTVIAATLMFGAASAREVAYCDSGFNIKLESGDKASCAKTVTDWVVQGPRHCIGDGIRVSDEANDFGDKCKSPNALLSAISGPALDCALDPAYGIGATRNKFVQNGRDQCEKWETRTVYGDVKTRQE